LLFRSEGDLLGGDFPVGDFPDNVPGVVALESNISLRVETLLSDLRGGGLSTLREGEVWLDLTVWGIEGWLV